MAHMRITTSLGPYNFYASGAQPIAALCLTLLLAGCDPGTGSSEPRASAGPCDHIERSYNDYANNARRMGGLSTNAGGQVLGLAAKEKKRLEVCHRVATPGMTPGEVTAAIEQELARIEQREEASRRSAEERSEERLAGLSDEQLTSIWRDVLVFDRRYERIARSYGISDDQVRLVLRHFTTGEALPGGTPNSSRHIWSYYSDREEEVGREQALKEAANKFEVSLSEVGELVNERQADIKRWREKGRRAAEAAEAAYN